MVARDTRATRLLASLAIPHALHLYTHDPASRSYGHEAAAALGIPPEQVFKTLIASVDGNLAAAVVPVAGQLDLKALAAALGGKRAEMAAIAVAERTTGYVAGGISPIAQRKRLPTVIDGAALACATVFCSAGQRGLELALAPADLVKVTGAIVAPITKPGA